MTRVAASSISVAYDGRVILDRVAVQADSGEVVAVVGPNGAGKTTLLRCLAGDAAVDAGTVACRHVHQPPVAQVAPGRVQGVVVVDDAGHVCRTPGGSAPWDRAPGSPEPDAAGARGQLL